MKPIRLKEAREERGWSQARVAEALGVTTRTVRRWEQGEVKPYLFYQEQLCVSPPPMSKIQPVRRRGSMLCASSLAIVVSCWSLMMPGMPRDALAFRIGGPHSAHVLTTHQPQIAYSFAEEGAIVGPELDDADGLLLLSRYVPQLVLQDVHGARVLVNAVGGLPLALTLIGRHLASQAFTGQPRRLRTALDRLHDADRLNILCHLAAFAEVCAEYGQVEQYAQEGLALARRLGQVGEECSLLATLGRMALKVGDYQDEKSPFRPDFSLNHP